MVRHDAFGDSDQTFRTCSDQRQPLAAVEVEHVGRRVDLPQIPIRVERVERGRSGEALAGDGLDDVALDDMLPHFGDVCLVALLADVGDGLRFGPWYWTLLGQRKRAGGGQQGSDGLDLLSRSSIPFRDGVILLLRGRNVDVRDDVEGLEEVVEGDDGVAEHVQALWDAQRVLHVARRLWLEMPHAVVGDVADCAAFSSRLGKRSKDGAKTDL
jgi:hypothetical protein